MSSAYWRNVKREKEKELKDYRKRLSEVETIQSNFNSTVLNYNESINVINSALVDALQNGIKKCTNIAIQCNAITTLKEYESDNKVQESKGNLSSEWSRVNEKITELQIEINNIQNTINAEEQREREEARRRDEERREAARREAEQKTK